jgi:hypothetical protein
VPSWAFERLFSTTLFGGFAASSFICSLGKNISTVKPIVLAYFDGVFDSVESSFIWSRSRGNFPAAARLLTCSPGRACIAHSRTQAIFSNGCDMTDSSIFIRFGEFQAGAFGLAGIIALVLLAVLAIGARWRGLL